LADPVTEVPSITTTAALATDKTQAARHVVYANLCQWNSLTHFGLSLVTDTY